MDNDLNLYNDQWIDVANEKQLQIKLWCQCIENQWIDNQEEMLYKI